jgi:hypothetical protein
MQEIISEIFLDHITFVTTAYYEIIDTMSRITLHDMPKDWFMAYLDHRLRSQVSLFTQASA